MSEEDNNNNNNNNDTSDNEQQMTIKPIADIEEVPIIETEIIEKPLNDILKIIEEKPEETVKEETPEATETIEDKPKKTTQRDKDKERVNCPDCGKELSYHVLKYDHKKFCKAVKKQEDKPPEITPEPETRPPEPEKPSEPPKLIRQKSVTLKAKPKVTAPGPIKPLIITEIPTQVTHEMVAEYVKNERVAKAQRARQRFSALASSG